MAKHKPLHICDDRRGVEAKHVWAEPFADGDTCACGRFALTLHSPHGYAAEIKETPTDE